MLRTLDEIDPNFVQDLQESQHSVNVVAEFLRGKGLSVIVPPTRVRAHSEERHKFRDVADLFVNGAPWEVKRRLRAFTNADDFPFSSVLVDLCSIYDRKDEKPKFYVICNIDVTAGLLISPGKTFQFWTKQTRFCADKGRDQTSYYCPKKLVTRSIVFNSKRLET